jgi:hypothetical protein
MYRTLVTKAAAKVRWSRTRPGQETNVSLWLYLVCANPETG